MVFCELKLSNVLTRTALSILICFGLTACGEGEAPMAPTSGDAAVDPVILIHTDDPAKNLVIAAGGQSGLVVYDRSGAVVSRTTDGRMAAVDLRSGFPITINGGDPSSALPIDVVAAADRTGKTIAVYMLNPDSGALSRILDDPIPSRFDDPTDLCLYRSAVNGKLYAFATDRDGTVSQWLLYDSGRGSLRGTIQRTLNVGSGAQGCEVDDADGAVFITDQGGTIWRYGAEPKDSFNERVKVEGDGTK